MATIDQGGFGYRSRSSVPMAINEPGKDQSGVEALAQGGRTLAKDVTDVQHAERDQQYLADERTRRELEEKTKEENRARSAAALVDYDLDATQAGKKVAQDLQDGTITREDVPGKFKEAEQKIRATALGQIPQDQQQFIAPRLAKSASRVQLELNAVSEKHRQSEILGYASTITDGMAKQAIQPGADLNRIQRDYDQAMRVLLPTGGKNARDVEKVIQDFKDKSTVDFMITRENERNEDLPGLKDLKKMILDDKAYPNIDPEKRNILVHSVNGAIARLEAKHAGDEARVTAELAGDLQSTEKAILTGNPASADLMVSLQKRSQGTVLEPHFQRLQQTNAFIGQFVNAPVSSAQSAVLDLNARIRSAKTPGEMTSLLNMRDSLRSFVETKQKGLKDAPMETAVNDGAPNVVLDWTNAQSLKSALSSRVAITRGQQKQNPGASLGILYNTEASQFKEYLDTQPPKEQVKLLGVLTAGINDPVVTAHTMKQINKESPMLAQAGILVSWGQPGAAETLLDGQHLLLGKDGKHGAMTVPADEKFRDLWRSKVGNAYTANRDAEDQDFEAAKMMYVSLARTAGKTAQSDVDPSIWKKAIDMSTGGVTEFNSANVVLPYGMDSTAFKNKAHEAMDKAFQSSEIAGAAKAGIKPAPAPENETRAQHIHRIETARREAEGQPYGLITSPYHEPGTNDVVENGTLSRNFLKDLPLESVGQGVYRVHNGSGYIVNDAGYPLLLDLSKPTPGYRWDDRTTMGRPVTRDSTNPDNPTAFRGTDQVGIDAPTKLPAPSETIKNEPYPIDKTQLKRDKKPPKGGQ